MSKFKKIISSILCSVVISLSLTSCTEVSVAHERAAEAPGTYSLDGRAVNMIMIKLTDLFENTPDKKKTVDEFDASLKKYSYKSGNFEYLYDIGYNEESCEYLDGITYVRYDGYTTDENGLIIKDPNNVWCSCRVSVVFTISDKDKAKSLYEKLYPPLMTSFVDEYKKDWGKPDDGEPVDSRGFDDWYGEFMDVRFIQMQRDTGGSYTFYIKYHL